MTKQEFKERFIINLRSYLQDKQVPIYIRLLKKKELTYIDTEISSVRTVTHEGFTWRVEVRKPVPDLSELMLLAHYKTADVSWNYKGKKPQRK